MAKILIVDDSAFARNSLKMSVENGGHEIAGLAKNSEQAFAMFKSLDPEIVLLDYLMAGKDGMEVLEEIIQHDPGARVIMVSGAGDSTVEEKALKVGAKAFIGKTYAQKEILKLIDQVMET